MRSIGAAAALAICLVTLAETAEAHPGHAAEVVPSSSVWHYLLQPEHLATTLLVSLCGVCITMFLYRHRRLTYKSARVHNTH